MTAAYGKITKIGASVMESNRLRNQYKARQKILIVIDLC